METLKPEWDIEKIIETYRYILSDFVNEFEYSNINYLYDGKSSDNGGIDKLINETMDNVTKKSKGALFPTYVYREGYVIDIDFNEDPKITIKAMCDYGPSFKPEGINDENIDKILEQRFNRLTEFVDKIKQRYNLMISEETKNKIQIPNKEIKRNIFTYKLLFSDDHKKEIKTDKEEKFNLNLL